MVIVHCFRHPGQTPPVSNVFQLCWQLHIHRSSARGCHPHNGHLMRPPPLPPCEVSSGTAVGFEGRTVAGESPVMRASTHTVCYETRSRESPGNLVHIVQTGTACLIPLTMDVNVLRGKHANEHWSRPARP